MQCTTENSWIQGRPNIDLFIFEAQLSSKNRARTTGPESCALYEWMQSLYERTQLCLQAVTNPSLCFFPFVWGRCSVRMSFSLSCIVALSYVWQYHAFLLPCRWRCYTRPRTQIPLQDTHFMDSVFILVLRSFPCWCWKCFVLLGLTGLFSLLALSHVSSLHPVLCFVLSYFSNEVFSQQPSQAAARKRAGGEIQNGSCAHVR